MGLVTRLTADRWGPRVRALDAIERLCQYVLLMRLAVAGLALLVWQSQDPGRPTLYLAAGVIVALNYAALRHWPTVIDKVRLADKPWYLILDVVVAATLVGVSGTGTPMVLYLVGSGLLAGLVFTARLAAAATLAATATYVGVLIGHAGLSPGGLDVHSTVTPAASPSNGRRCGACWVRSSEACGRSPPCVSRPRFAMSDCAWPETCTTPSPRTCTASG
jgi:hypothetical protein